MNCGRNLHFARNKNVVISQFAFVSSVIKKNNRKGKENIILKGLVFILYLVFNLSTQQEAIILLRSYFLCYSFSYVSCKFTTLAVKDLLTLLLMTHINYAREEVWGLTHRHKFFFYEKISIKYSDISSERKHEFHKVVHFITQQLYAHCLIDMQRLEV